MKTSQQLEGNLCCVTMECSKNWDKLNSLQNSLKIKFCLFTLIQITIRPSSNTSQEYLTTWLILLSTITSILKMVSLLRLKIMVLNTGFSLSINFSLRMITTERQWGLLSFCLTIIKQDSMESLKNTSLINWPCLAKLFWEKQLAIKAKRQFWEKLLYKSMLNVAILCGQFKLNIPFGQKRK